MTYQQLTLEERRMMASLRASGTNNAEIGRILKRDRSTIGREFSRNLHWNGNHIYYTYSKAHQKAMSRRTVTTVTDNSVESRIAVPRRQGQEPQANGISGQHLIDNGFVNQLCRSAFGEQEYLSFLQRYGPQNRFAQR